MLEKITINSTFYSVIYSFLAKALDYRGENGAANFDIIKRMDYSLVIISL